MTIDELLQQICYYDNRNDVSVDELAMALKKHSRSVYHYIEGERDISVETLRTLAHYLAQAYEDCRIAEFFLPAGFQISRVAPQTDGSIADEMLAISEAGGHAIAAERRGDHKELLARAEEIIRQGVALKAEAINMMK